MKNITPMILAALVALLTGRTVACWFEDPDLTPGYEDGTVDSTWFSDRAKDLLDGSASDASTPDFGPNRQTEVSYLDDSGATVTVRTIIKDGYKTETRTREYIDPVSGYKVIETESCREGQPPKGAYEAFFSGSLKIFDSFGNAVYTRYWHKKALTTNYYPDFEHYYTTIDLITYRNEYRVNYDVETNSLISITKIETTITDTATETRVPVTDPVTGDPVVDPVTGEPVVETILSPTVKETKTETSTTTPNPETGGSTTETEIIVEDESGSVTETVSKTETVTPNPETGGSTTESEAVKRDGQGNVTEIVSKTETVTPNPATQITVTVTQTETRDADGNVTGQTTTRWAVCGVCEAEGDWLVCPNASQTCPDCAQSLHGVFSHNCPGAPGDPTQPDPGTNPQEGGNPDATPYPEIARFFFSQINQQAITKPVGTTYRFALPMSIFVASTPGVAPLQKTIYLHCVPDNILSGATYSAAVTSATTGNFTPPAPPLLLFGRSLYPNLTPIKGSAVWGSGDEFLLILSGDPDVEDALLEVSECCNGVGCRYHLRTTFNDQQTKPGR